MTDLNKLERLARLRDSGALTSEEFEAEKTKLLTPQPDEFSSPTAKPSLMWGSAIIFGAMVVSAALYLLGPSSLDSEGEANKSALPDPIAQLSSESEINSNSSAPEGTYAWATSIFRVGENPDFIESVLGPPKQKSSVSLFYNLDGCVVNYLIDGTTVSGIDMSVTEKCNPEIKGQAITPATKFGSIYEKFGFLQTSCLANCGNSADTTINYIIPGPHADNFIGVSYTTFDASDGMNVWQEEIATRNGVSDPWDLPQDAFLCPPKPSPSVLDAMRNAPVSGVTIGVSVENCAAW